MRILQIALITQKGNVFNVKMQIDEIVFESKEEVREKLLSVFANRQDAVVDVVIHSIQDELELSDYSNEQLKAELKRIMDFKDSFDEEYFHDWYIEFKESIYLDEREFARLVKAV